MSFKWKDLDYWKSGEYQVVEENLKFLTQKGILWNPGKKNLFAALRATPFDKVKVVILGQDPYPNTIHATGLAFSVPPTISQLPPTAKIILSEYSTDLGYPAPSTGDLSPWCAQGVLLWNVVPSCSAGRSLSHHWPEWELLTQEILTKLVDKNIVCAALGMIARQHLKHINPDDCPIIETGHPSPRGDFASRSPFTGSRLFSSINGLLCKQGLTPVDWKLD